MITKSKSYKQFVSGFYWFCLILFCVRVVLPSWLEEDAFITFRVVDNFVQGYGLRWNINERVQSYTNPLWMLLHIVLHPLTGNVILSTFLLSWLCLIGTLVIVRYTFGFGLLRHTILFLIPLLVSPTLTLFFTSGLETPLLSFLFVAFGFVLIRRPSHYWFWLSFITATSLVCRLDVSILYAPVWAYLFCKCHKELNVKEIVFGAIPIIAWLLFSFIYYGFLLPNTALAKLNTNLPELDYLNSGLAYTLDFILADPWSALLISAGILYFPFCAGQSLGQRTKEPDTHIAATISIGVTCYCLYIIYIGGYQLSLRMYSLPVIAMYWLWLWRMPSLKFPQYVFYMLFALAASFFALTPEERLKFRFINKEQISGIPSAQYLFIKNPGSWIDYRLNLHTITHRPDHTPKSIYTSIDPGVGQLGYYNGPFRIIIDPLALGDPLLARLPSVYPHLVRVSHIWRSIPAGYLDAVKTGSTEQMSAPLAEYYKKLRLITQGEIWDPERLETIIRFNLGEYDDLLKQYLSENRK